MNEQFRKFRELLFQRGITDRQQLLREAVRVQLTREYIQREEAPSADIEEDQDALFNAAKATEPRLDYFPGDRELFQQLFVTGKDFDLLDFAVDTYKKDRTGFILSPGYLTDYFHENIDRQQPETVLIAEAEKFSNGLRKIVRGNQNRRITLLTQHLLVYEMLKLVFRVDRHVEVLQASIYHKLELPNSFEWILAIPDFVSRVENPADFIAGDATSAAVENLIKMTAEKGVFCTGIPARFAFAGDTVSQLRSWIGEHYGMKSFYTLPEGTFRPYTGAKTYLIGFSNGRNDETSIGNLELENQTLHLKNEKDIQSDSIHQADDWRIELFLSENQDELQRFQQSHVEKVKLKDVADVFRGKSVMKKDIKPGNVYVLNISNIEDGEVRTDNMDTMDEEDRKIRRYELVENDLVMTCRGTVNKAAVFRGATETVIASANIIVIRFKKEMISDYVKIFLESPIGRTLVRSFQRGTTVMNINPKDIAEMEVPFLDPGRQREIVADYQEEFERYKQTIQQATDRWTNKKENVYQRLLDEGEQ